jgi:hypothetical protein
VEDRAGDSSAVSALILTIANRILTLLDMPGRVRQNRGPAHLNTLIFAHEPSWERRTLLLR